MERKGERTHSTSEELEIKIRWLWRDRSEEWTWPDRLHPIDTGLMSLLDQQSEGRTLGHTVSIWPEKVGKHANNVRAVQSKHTRRSHLRVQCLDSPAEGDTSQRLQP